jgi:hypothetical protein
MEVVNINDRSVKKRKEELLEILDVMRQMIEKDEIAEFVATTMSAEGEVKIHACVKDVAGGVGMYEIGKHIFIAQES